MRHQRAKGSGSIYKNSRGQWVASLEVGWTERGTRKRLTLKARTRAEVTKRLAAAKVRLATEGPSASFTTITVKSWIDQWIDSRVKTVRPGTFVADRSAIHRWIIPTLGHIRLDALTPADIRRLITVQEEAGLTIATMQRTHAVLGKILTDAVADGYQVSQRARETSGPGSAPSGRQALSSEDARRILAVASRRSDHSRWVAALIEGLRPAEALGLTWDMIDFRRDTMTLAWQLKALPYVHKRDADSGFRIPRGFECRQICGSYHLVRPKTRAGTRVVPMVPALSESLRQWRDENPWDSELVWTTADGAVRSADYDRKEWYHLVEEADVWITQSDGRVRLPLLYEARHTAATLMLANGVDETTIKAILGHSTILSTQSYLHTDLTRTREAVEASARSLGIGAGP